ncbi:MAG: hypothetical protein ACOCUL_02365 [Bacteroidota bacterium]
MGSIISTKTTKNGNIVFEVKMEYDEALQLKGHVQNVHLFTENVADTRTNLSGRGKNEATKYFLIPKELRKDIKLTDKVRCQKLETDSKIFFVYVVDKLRL